MATPRKTCRKSIYAAAAITTLALTGLHRAGAQAALQVTYGSNGVQTVRYNNVTLEDLAAYGGDAFHIWHMKMTDLTGKMVSSGEYGWGENHDSRVWDPGSKSWTYGFVWGKIQVQFQQNGNNLDMRVTETNYPTSGVILDGATIYPLALHFPQLPTGFYDAGYPQLTYNTTGPSVTLADYGMGELVAVVPDASRPLYSGFMPLGAEPSGPGYTALISGTSPDGLAAFQPHNDRPVAPGQTDTFTVSLRFAPSGTPAGTLAADAYQSWAAIWPPQLKWTDKRIIGTAYLSSSAQGDPTKPSGYPNNPRRYFNSSDPNDFNVTTTAGLARFQARILKQAQNNVANLQQLNAQGIITWDFEGQQYPQQTSYVCSPDQIAQVSPEMESVVTDAASPYAGMKLDDAYFRTMRDAGFRIGVCIRPQHFTLNGDGTAQQVYLPDAAVGAEMLRKMKYAHDRWGATLFYIDSTVESNGAVLDAGIFQQLAAALPDSLLMPEESTPKFYAYTAPFRTFIFHGDLGTDLSVYNYYPNAFSAVLVNDVDPSQLAAHRADLTASVKRGDILMVHADYWQANNPTVVQMYIDAGVTTPAPTPAPTPTPTPVVPPAPNSPVTITSPAAGTTLTGQVQVVGQINLNLDAGGSFLMVDGAEIGTRRITGGPFLYPLDTTTLADGAHTLQLWAHDTNNDTVLSPALAVAVANGSVAPPVPTPAPPIVTPAPPAPAPAPTPAPPVVTPPAPANSQVSLTYPQAGITITGFIQAQAQITLNLDAAGSFLMVDGVEIGTRRITGSPYIYGLDTTTLPDGLHTLQVWAHDTNNSTTVSAPVMVTVANHS